MTCMSELLKKLITYLKSKFQPYIDKLDEILTYEGYTYIELCEAAGGGDGGSIGSSDGDGGDDGGWGYGGGDTSSTSSTSSTTQADIDRANYVNEALGGALNGLTDSQAKDFFGLDSTVDVSRELGTGNLSFSSSVDSLGSIDLGVAELEISKVPDVVDIGALAAMDYALQGPAQSVDISSDLGRQLSSLSGFDASAGYTGFTTGAGTLTAHTSTDNIGALDAFGGKYEFKSGLLTDTFSEPAGFTTSTLGYTTFTGTAVNGISTRTHDLFGIRFTTDVHYNSMGQELGYADSIIADTLELFGVEMNTKIADSIQSTTNTIGALALNAPVTAVIGYGLVAVADVLDAAELGIDESTLNNVRAVGAVVSFVSSFVSGVQTLGNIASNFSELAAMTNPVTVALVTLAEFAKLENAMSTLSAELSKYGITTHSLSMSNISNFGRGDGDDRELQDRVTQGDIDALLRSYAYFLIADNPYNPIQEPTSALHVNINNTQYDRFTYMAGGEMYNAQSAGNPLYAADRHRNTKLFVTQTIEMPQHVRQYLMQENSHYVNLEPIDTNPGERNGGMDAITIARRAEYRRLLDAYNKAVAEYKALVDAYNAKVASINARLDQLKAEYGSLEVTTNTAIKDYNDTVAKVKEVLTPETTEYIVMENVSTGGKTYYLPEGINGTVGSLYLQYSMLREAGVTKPVAGGFIFYEKTITTYNPDLYTTVYFDPNGNEITKAEYDKVNPLLRAMQGYTTGTGLDIPDTTQSQIDSLNSANEDIQSNIKKLTDIKNAYNAMVSDYNKITETFNTEAAIANKKIETAADAINAFLA